MAQPYKKVNAGEEIRTDPETGWQYRKVYRVQLFYGPAPYRPNGMWITHGIYSTEGVARKKVHDELPRFQQHNRSITDARVVTGEELIKSSINHRFVRYELLSSIDNMSNVPRRVLTEEGKRLWGMAKDLVEVSPNYTGAGKSWVYFKWANVSPSAIGIEVNVKLFLDWCTDQEYYTALYEKDGHLNCQGVKFLIVHVSWTPKGLEHAAKYHGKKGGSSNSLTKIL